MSTHFSAGMILTADLLNGLITAAYRTSNATVRTTTTLAADDQLVVPLVASARYLMFGYLAWTGTDQTADLKLNYSLPSGATMPKQSFFAPTTAVTSTTSGPLDSGSASSAGVDHTRGTVNGSLAGIVAGNVITDVTAGNLTVNWASNGGGAGVALDTGCWIACLRVT